MNEQLDRIEMRIAELTGKLDEAFVSIEKTRKYMFWTGVITVVVIVVPLLLLPLFLPAFLASQGVDTSSLQGLYMSLKSLITSIAGAALFASFIPALALAQSYPYTNCGGTYNGTYQNCTPGNLSVVMQVIGQNINGITRNPSDFSIAVAGANASPSSFPGSQSGTSVSVGGQYVVTVLPMQGYTPSYSVGCTGTLINNNSATCVITENNYYNNYNSFPTPYPYQYATPALTCVPPTQTVNLGQTVTFSAQGGDYSQYNWQTPTRSFLNIGEVLNVAFTQTGTQAVTVTNGTQTATCTVNVVPNGAPATTYINPYQPGQPQAYVTPTYVPAFPNTGFEPQNGAEVAFAAVVLMALALVIAPYVRKAFAVVLG